MSEHVDAVVIGAGVVGLAVGRALALSGREVIVLEAANAIGTETSSRNSEVVHAGIYYPQASLKAQLCVQGKTRLYSYCAERGIAAETVGKLIVATSMDQVEQLKALKANAERNGVTDLAWLTAEQARAMEPQLACVRALFSPSSGIVDSHAYMLALQGDLENAGGLVAFNARVQAGAVTSSGIVLRVGGESSVALTAALVVNAAGLHAPALARLIDGMPDAAIPRPYFAKGNYFALTGVKSPFKHLIYPVPEQAGLGIHATIDLGGQTRFGPDVEWVTKITYEINPDRAGTFYQSIRQYWPALPDNALAPAYSGIRPKIVGPGQAAADFVIQGPDVHAVPGLINLFGIESPGLTSSLALADSVASLSTQMQS